MSKLKDKPLEYVSHPFEPVFDLNSEILILGSVPSVKSREAKFYYAHPGNRFWLIMSNILGLDLAAKEINEKKFALIKNNIAIWDVIKSCKIYGSSDSSIKDVKVNDIKYIIVNSKIKKLYSNGSLAYNLYMKYCFKDVGIDMIKLPSTSPANASYNINALMKQWSVITKDLNLRRYC